jgi:hypothetical protein
MVKGIQFLKKRAQEFWEAGKDFLMKANIIFSFSFRTGGSVVDKIFDWD